MVTKTLINPFNARVGGTVPSEFYVSRPNEENIINRRVLQPDFGNLSLVGLPKTGKSTLVSHCLVEKKDILASEKTILVYYQMGSTRSALDFYKKIIKKFHTFFVLNFPDDEKYLKYVQNIAEQIKSETELTDITDLIDDYFRRVRHLGYKEILILDEFDRAQEIFTFEDFQFLREISYFSNDKICLVTCSRKPLKDIEKKAPKDDLSVFAMTFIKCEVKMYDTESINFYWDMAREYWDFNNFQKEFTNYVAGANPWLMDVINDYLFEHPNITKEKELLIEVKATLMEGYDHLIRVLNSETLLNSAVQLVVGPLFDVCPTQIESLLQYGFLKEISPEMKKEIFNGMELGPILDEKSYVCFSDYCSLDFYRRYYANVPYFSEWSETENLLRNLIVQVFEVKKWEGDWYFYLHNDLALNKPWPKFDIVKWENNVKSLRLNKNDMINNFESLKGGHDVHFTLTGQIFDIFIRPMQKWYNTYVFKGTWNDWNNKFNFLVKLRNPIAHNNTEVSSLEDEIRIAIDYCKEIKYAIREWQNNKTNSK